MVTSLEVEHTLMFPLVVYENLIGICVMSGILVYLKDLIDDMEVFFKYFSLMLNYLT